MRSGNHVYLNICPTTKMADTFPSLHPPCSAWGAYVYSSIAFEAFGLDVQGLANSALVEFCNNANNWGIVMGLVDAQTELANNAWSAPGSWIDADVTHLLRSIRRAHCLLCVSALQYDLTDVVLSCRCSLLAATTT